LREGAHIVVSGRHDDAGKTLATELRALGVEAEHIRADVRLEDDVRSLVDRAVKRFGGLDVAVNTAGTEGKPGPLTEQTAEIAPPWVQTDLLNRNNEPRAMPLAEFISETIKVIGTGAQEVLVERAKPLRNNVGPNEDAFVTQFNDMMAQPNSPGA